MRAQRVFLTSGYPNNLVASVAIVAGGLIMQICLTHTGRESARHAQDCFEFARPEAPVPHHAVFPDIARAVKVDFRAPSSPGGKTDSAAKRACEDGKYIMARNDGSRIDKLRENIERAENGIEQNLRAIEALLSLESMLPALADGGKEVFAEKAKPLISGLGDTMNEMLSKVFGSVSRDPLPVFLMGVGAGLVIRSLYSIRKTGGDGERLAFADPATRSREKTEVPKEEESGSGSSNAIMLGLSALALGAAMSGLVPDIDSEKVEGWKTDLLSKAGEAGEELIKGAERMLRKKLQSETM